MQDNDTRQKIERHRRLSLEYANVNARINTLLAKHRGKPEIMPEEELTHYRELARQRDELYNDIRWLERQLLSESSDDLAPDDDTNTTP